MPYNLPKRLTREEILSIPKLIESMTDTQVAQKLGCSRHTVLRWVHKLKRYGVDVPERKKGRPKHVTQA